MELEGPLLRVPFEQLKAAARTRTRLVAELTEVGRGMGSGGVPPDADAALLDDVEARLVSLKRKVRPRALRHAQARR
jgi:hypothetical protein